MLLDDGRELGGDAVRGVGDMFVFVGHVADPESVLEACDALAKPTREDNPWGRDILEALGAGKPVISIGRYNRFVETDVTGVLLARYDSEAAADALVALDADRQRTRRMGEAGRARVMTLCDGPSRAKDLIDVWRSVIANREAQRLHSSHG